MTVNIDSARLTLMLNDLRLPAIKQGWPGFAERADKEGWPAARFQHRQPERGRVVGKFSHAVPAMRLASTRLAVDSQLAGAKVTHFPPQPLQPRSTNFFFPPPTDSRGLLAET